MDNKIQKKESTFLDHDVDVDSLYKTLILEIDNFRSYTDISDPILSVENLLNKTNTIINFSEIRKSSSLQESRLHTFYRLIGLPIVSENGMYYSPGFNKNDNSEKIQKTKINILKNFSSEYLNGFSDREEYYKTIVPEALSKDYIGSYYILTSFNLRKLDIAFDKSTELFSNLSIEQTFDLLSFDSRGLDLSELKFQDGSKILESSDYTAQRSKLLRPIGVDPRIDFSVTPSTRRMAQPFLKKEDIEIRNNEFLKKPFIEKVISERFNSSLTKSIFPEFVKQASDYYKTFSIISEDETFREVVKINPDAYKQDDDKIRELRFLEAIKKIRGLAFVLKYEKEIITKAQSENFWLPKITSKDLSNFNLTDANLFGDNNVNSFFYTDVDKKYINIKKEQELSESLKNLNNLLLSNIKNNDPSQFVFDNYLNFLDGDADRYSPDKKEMIAKTEKRRSNNISQGNKSFVNIERILGDFSGLGILDVICYITALYLLPKENILGLLDDAAFARCKNILKIPDTQVKSDVLSSMKEYVKNLHSMYALAEKIVLDIHVLGNNK